MQIEVQIVSLLALVVSAYSIYLSKRRGDNSDNKELTAALTSLSSKVQTLEDNSPAIKTLGATLATMTTKIETIESVVLSKPTLGEQVVVHDQKLKDHDRRITTLEKGCPSCQK